MLEEVLVVLPVLTQVAQLPSQVAVVQEAVEETAQVVLVKQII